MSVWARFSLGSLVSCGPWKTHGCSWGPMGSLAPLEILGLLSPFGHSGLLVPLEGPWGLLGPLGTLGPVGLLRLLGPLAPLEPLVSLDPWRAAGGSGPPGIPWVSWPPWPF